MIEITDDMVDTYLTAKGRGQTMVDIKIGLLAVAPLIAAAYQEPTHGTVDDVDDGRTELAAEALRNAVAMWERWFSNWETLEGVDRADTVLVSANRFLEWLNR